MADPIRVNGNQYSWGHIIFKLDGDLYTGFTSIGFADKRERVKAYGMGRAHAPRGRSGGKYSVEPVKVTGWKNSVQLLRAGIAAKAGGKSFGNYEFQGLVQYIEPGSSETPISIDLDRLVWSANNASDEESADPLKEDFELDAMLIRWNGLVLADSQDGNV